MTIGNGRQKEDWFILTRRVQPVIDYYEKESMHKLIRINGEQGMEEVHKEILEKSFQMTILKNTEEINVERGEQNSCPYFAG